MKKEVVRVEIGDLYQFLIDECRYGYRRNNHLMPWGAYSHVKEYLPKMLKVNPEHALHTAMQICEECISDELLSYFYDGLEDEHGNRAEAIKFIRFLIEWIHTNGKENYYPGNYNLFLENCGKDNVERYKVYEVINNEEILLTETPVSKLAYKDVIFDKIGEDVVTFNQIDEYSDFPRRVIGSIYRIKHPVERTFVVKLTQERL